jgi:hypothetical protein
VGPLITACWFVISLMFILSNCCVPPHTHLSTARKYVQHNILCGQVSPFRAILQVLTNEEALCLTPVVIATK